ncbi:iron transporter [Vibrio cholerae]|nr:iron transporter [Vibrio cholerae]
MVTAVVFEFSVMRCQPLRRALGVQFKTKMSHLS